MSDEQVIAIIAGILAATIGHVYDPKDVVEEARAILRAVHQT